MSGQETLQELDRIVGTTNELLLSPEVKMMDVGGGVMRPTNAMVMTNLATLLGGAMPYASVALGIAGTTDGTNFSVVSSAQDEYVQVYRNVAGEAVLVDTYPNSDAIRAVTALISSVPVSAPETVIEVTSDKEGNVGSMLTTKRLRTVPFDIYNDGPGRFWVGDGEGNASIYIDDNMVVLGQFVFFNGQDSVADPFALPPLFAPLVVTAEGYGQSLYLKNMLYKRELEPQVVASIASKDTAAMDTGPVLTMNPGEYGDSAVLNLRDVSAPDARRLMSVNVKNVPAQSVPSSPKILIIGDSISNRQGGLFIKQILEDLGFTPVFIGTINGSAVPDNSNNAAGVLGEAREGWESGDFTYAVTDRALVVAAGDESTYEEMTKTDKWPRNPFLRAATGADPASIIRNGYVFDPAFYQSRFGLQTPDIVLNLLGTNDARDRTDATVYDEVLSNDTLMHNQIRAAWPNAKIIRSIPGTAYNTERNGVWTNRYVPIIRAMQQAAVNRADAKFILAPIWALTNPEAGYVYAPGSIGLDGFSVADWSDSIHPAQAARLALFEAIAPYVAAAATNII
ncbi:MULTISPECIES: SGNH/GDSL hydrolase family protein [unclassified Pseudomonas]|uniref:SGNH/GDSL hydrolase family protein n=1 Tax=unclassified Pseudomonas TaxID=196821 RepID=UPI0015B7269A|nr:MULTISPECIES: SGNH/GDSL hydrolase family protein [unclassified Pseudomonas]